MRARVTRRRTVAFLRTIRRFRLIMTTYSRASLTLRRPTATFFRRGLMLTNARVGQPITSTGNLFPRYVSSVGVGFRSKARATITTIVRLRHGKRSPIATRQYRTTRRPFRPFVPSRGRHPNANGGPIAM